jgi:hypothetical protein
MYLDYILLSFTLRFCTGSPTTVVNLPKHVAGLNKEKKKKSVWVRRIKGILLSYVYIFSSSGVSKNRKETKLHSDLVFCVRVKRSLSLSLSHFLMEEQWLGVLSEIFGSTTKASDGKKERKKKT